MESAQLVICEVLGPYTVPVIKEEILLRIGHSNREMSDAICDVSATPNGDDAWCRWAGRKLVCVYDQ